MAISRSFKTATHLQSYAVRLPNTAPSGDSQVLVSPSPGDALNWANYLATVIGWNVGAGAPGVSLGADGEMYLDTSSGDVYGPKDQGSWGPVVMNITGPSGPAGSQGTQGPQGAEGPEGPTGSQGPIGSTGPAGSSSVWHTGNGAVLNPLGDTGDMYLDLDTGDIWGPKEPAGNWPGSVSMNIVGPQGPQGPEGSQGPQGDPGPSRVINVETFTADMTFDEEVTYSAYTQAAPLSITLAATPTYNGVWQLLPITLNGDGITWSSDFRDANDWTVPPQINTQTARNTTFNFSWNAALGVVLVNERGSALDVSGWPAITANSFTVANLEEVLITPSMIAANDPDGDNNLITFTVSGVTNGAFQDNGTPVTVFTQQKIVDGDITFEHAGNNLEPGYNITCTDSDGNPNTGGVLMGAITWTPNVPPQIVTNEMTIEQGQAIVVDTSVIQVTDSDTADADITINLSGIQEGQFEYASNPGVAVTSFPYSDVVAGVLRFVHNNDIRAPIYEVTASDAWDQDGPSNATVNFTLSSEAPDIPTIIDHGILYVGAGQNNATISVTVPPGLQNAMLFAFPAAVDNDYAVNGNVSRAPYNDCKADGVDMALLARSEGVTVGRHQLLEAWTLNSPPAGTYNVVASADSGTNSRTIAWCLIENAVQGVAHQVGVKYHADGTATIAHTLPTTTPNTLILDVLSGNNNTNIVPQSGQNTLRETGGINSRQELHSVSAPGTNPAHPLDYTWGVQDRALCQISISWAGFGTASEQGNVVSGNGDNVVGGGGGNVITS